MGKWLKDFCQIFYCWLKNNYFLVIVLILYFFVYSSGIKHFPPANTDESWIGEAAKMLFNSSRPDLTMFGGKIDLALFPSYTIALGLFFKLFGVGLVQGRIFSVFFGAIAIIFLYLIAKKLYHQRIAYLAIIFFVINPFILLNRIIRPELFVVALSLGALYFYLIGKNKNLNYFFSGILIAIACIGHPHAGFILLTILSLFIFDFGWRFFLKKDFIYFFSGILLILISFFIFFIFKIKIYDRYGQSPEYLRDRLIFFKWDKIKSSLFGECNRWAIHCGQGKIKAQRWLNLGAIKYLWITGLGYLLVTFKNHRVLLSSIFFVVFGLTIIDSRKYFEYLILAVPFLSLALAILFDRLSEFIKSEIKIDKLNLIKNKIFYYCA